MPEYGHSRPPFTGDCADCFLLGVLQGSVHKELSICELKDRVYAEWGPTDSLLITELFRSIERLKDKNRFSVTDHHSVLENNLVRLSRRRR